MHTVEKPNFFSLPQLGHFELDFNRASCFTRSSAREGMVAVASVVVAVNDGAELA